MIVHYSLELRIDYNIFSVFGLYRLLFEWCHPDDYDLIDVIWMVIKLGNQAMLATPEGSFSLPYDATLPYRAKVVTSGEPASRCFA